MAHWMVRVNAEKPPHAIHGIRGQGIEISRWPHDPQWVIPFAFRPSKVHPRKENFRVDEDNLSTLRAEGRERAQRWRTAIKQAGVPDGASWRLVKREVSPTGSAPAVARVHAAGHMITHVNPSPPPTLTFEQLQEYFTHSTNAFIHRDELNHIRNYKLYHEQRLSALKVLKSDPPTGTVSRKTLEFFQTHHDGAIQHLRRREKAAQHNIAGHSAEETALWLSFGFDPPAEDALRLHHATTVEHTGAVQTSPVDEQGTDFGTSAAPVEVPTEPGSPVAEPEADDQNSSRVRYIRETLTAVLGQTKSKTCPEISAKKPAEEITASSPGESYAHPLLGRPRKSRSLPVEGTKA
ncbi:hypothetical protein MVEN_00152800 [Mycena venus]|uniref:Uncharacterized protein n=1 Tax=Mycena venus TaxID=2733690 RepID=A0A8H6Z2W6_9AGAR|nr:hypothetical protein MVEN_00152800 [Mycena venus]